MSIAQHRLPRAMIARRGPSGLVYSTSAVSSPGNLPLIVRWLFLLYIAFLEFYIDFVIPSVNLICFLFFSSYLFYHNPLSRRSFPSIPPVVAWFLIYIVIYALTGLFFSAEYLRDFLTRLFTLVQVIMFLWVA